MDTKTVIIREFPEELHKEFKTLCALEPMPMNRKIIKLVTTWVGEHHAMIEQIRKLNKK
ncbi:MAG: hypothetical protein WC905_01275 [Patescibacteria group bacterium]|jgi:hypothetical protein